MSSKEKNYKKIMIITIITSIIVVLGTVSYAFYQTAINGTVSGTIAKWSFTANNQVSSFDISLGELYPGKSGTYNITLSAENSGLDVYYELLIQDYFADSSFPLTSLLYWDSAYTKPIFSDTSSYMGRYGVIPKGSSVTIPLYLNWPYNNPSDEEGIDNFSYSSTPQTIVIAKQYTAYSGSIPMNLLGYDLVSFNSNKTLKETIVPVVEIRGECALKSEKITSTSGYLVINNNDYAKCSLYRPI